MLVAIGCYEIKKLAQCFLCLEVIILCETMSVTKNVHDKSRRL